jgi:hypothetical protein
MQDVTKLQERALSGVQDSEKLRQKEDDIKVVIETIPQLVWTSEVRSCVTLLECWLKTRAINCDCIGPIICNIQTNLFHCSRAVLCRI